MQDGLKVLVDRIVVDPNLHARWINTFSYLEYIGFRKIVKSQPLWLLSGRSGFLAESARRKVSCTRSSAAGTFRLRAIA